jgi:hypothetical protein
MSISLRVLFWGDSIGQAPYVEAILAEGYYEEVRIIPQRRRSEYGTLIGVGPGLCRTSENAVLAKFGEETCLHALR